MGGFDPLRREREKEEEELEMRHFWRKEETEEKIEGAFRFFSRREDIRNGMQEREPHSKKKKTCCRPRCAINVSGISGVDWKWSVSFWLA